MSHDGTWPAPSPVALDLIERVYRLSRALRAMEIHPDAAGVAMVLSLQEAFALLDHMNGPWRVAFMGSAAGHDGPGVELVQFDRAVLPKPGLKWGYLFGIALIVDDQGDPDTPSAK